MKKKLAARGSALLIAIIVVVMMLGIGGAFMAETVWRSKAQNSAILADETLMMCDAAGERVRRALFIYRYNTEPLDLNLNPPPDPSRGWSWNDILTYCQEQALTAPLATDGTLQSASTDPRAILTDHLSKMTSSRFMDYATKWRGGATGINNPANDDPVPAVRTRWDALDATTLGVWIGHTTPYLKGAFHIHVADNHDDGDGDPLKDADKKVIVTITATLPDGTRRQVESLVQYNFNPTEFNAVAAVTANSDIVVQGSSIIDGNNHDLQGKLTGAGNVFGIVNDNPPTNNQGTITMGNTNKNKAGSGVGGNGTAVTQNISDASLNGGLPGSTVQSGHPSFASGFPLTAEDALKLPTNSLMEAAKSTNTYFTDYQAYNKAINDNGGEMFGGVVVYLDFSTPDSMPGSIAFAKPNRMNAVPSIVVVRNTEPANFTGELLGLLVIDDAMHITGSLILRGALVVTEPILTGNVFANGNANIEYSSDALRRLPNVGGKNCKVLSWKKVLK
jgi:type II secretory pathway pseudopilin PulG